MIKMKQSIFLCHITQRASRVSKPLEQECFDSLAQTPMFWFSCTNTCALYVMYTNRPTLFNPNTISVPYVRSNTISFYLFSCTGPVGYPKHRYLRTGSPSSCELSPGLLWLHIIYNQSFFYNNWVIGHNIRPRCVITSIFIYTFVIF
jgi:hypothetical protein